MSGNPVLVAAGKGVLWRLDKVWPNADLGMLDDQYCTAGCQSPASGPLRSRNVITERLGRWSDDFGYAWSMPD